ncbi:SubName: Full=Uncharacterized protein {ECO:0000313/EMBL:CCA72708.1} [Serendipita indica DSM 11827]|nr:SubName: Full=Uncharacterized protein {ECO:0000313/EMBL:CCA72708.1} [Serendipita indica DSM 11827]
MEHDATNSMELVAEFQSCQYVALAAITLWAYDVLLTAADEVEVLWSRQGRFIDFLYLTGRYLPIVGLFHTWNSELDDRGRVLARGRAHWLTYLSCRIVWTISNGCMVIQTIISQTIFTMRLCVIYCTARHIRRLLFICLVVFNTAQLNIFIVAQYKMNTNILWDAVLNTCVAPEYNAWPMATIYFPPLILEFVIFVATIAHAFGIGSQLSVLGRTSTRRALRTLYIDGTLFFFGVIFLRIGSIIVFYVAPFGYQVLFTYLDYLLSSTLTSRFFLHFRRKVAEAHPMQPQTVMQAHDSGTSTNVDFRMQPINGIQNGPPSLTTDVSRHSHHVSDDVLSFWIETDQLSIASVRDKKQDVEAG